MSPQGPRPVEVRRVQNAPDLLQGQAHLPVEQNLLQPLHLSGPVEAVVVVPVPPGAQQTDAVVVPQSPGRQACQPGQLLDGVHAGITS